MKTKADKMKDLQTNRKHKLIIQKKISEDESGNPLEDEWGNQTEEWVDWKTVTAEKLELYGQEYYTAKSLGEEQTVKWKIKHVTFVEEIDTVNHRVIDVRKKDIYDIKDTDYLKDDGMWFIIKAEKSGELDG